MPRRARALFLAALAAALLACDPPPAPAKRALEAPLATVADRDFELEVCQQRVAELQATPALPGAPDYDAHRSEVLGRAVGEPMVFARTPTPFATPRPEGMHPGFWVGRLKSRHVLDKAALRRDVLRDGYVFSEHAYEAFALVRELTLTKLFDEERILLQRGDRIHELERHGRGDRSGYRFVAGPRKGDDAKLLFGDRVALTHDGLAGALHRDVRSLRDREGFERITVERHTDRGMLAKLRYGGTWTRAVIAADGPALTLTCLDASRQERTRIAAEVKRTAPKRQALAALRDAVDALAGEKLPFDRPRGVKDHLSDGQLRPLWEFAYKRGHLGFTHEEEGYLVFDGAGRPNPPQMCVSFILDAYERASGTWYAPQDQPRQRHLGGIDFNALGVTNRAGVLAFEQFAIEHPELFEASRFETRIPFAERERFFENLVAQADTIEAGDVVSIQGPKPDGYVHQHAILVADTDPVSGMAYSLADQMKWPRIRTWEGIMAEAPRRALLYHLRPKPELLLRLAKEAPEAPEALATTSR
ncbi:MAG: hypothetical protein R3B72_16635 [Polyangiaceae bacterium]